MTKLTAAAVERLFLECLFRDNEETTDPAFADGITAKFGFHRGRLQAHRVQIRELLDGLPDQFQAGKGDGWTFLNACVTRDGEHWGEHRNAEQLLALGIATGQANCLLFPRHMWPHLPGGVPFFVVGDPAAIAMCQPIFVDP